MVSSVQREREMRKQEEELKKQQEKVTADVIDLGVISIWICCECQMENVNDREVLRKT